MTPETKQRLITAGVVFGGIAALGVANRFGVDKELLGAASAVLLILAGSLRSMVKP
jgi:hypothetical protein